MSSGIATSSSVYLGLEPGLTSTVGAPSWVCTSYANITLKMCTRITPVQKSFLLTLMDGDVLKLNLLRAFLRLIFTLA